MVGYDILQYALPENGHVSRAFCRVENGRLTEISEHTHIEPRPDGTRFLPRMGSNSRFCRSDTVVNMNCLGLPRRAILA